MQYREFTYAAGVWDTFFYEKNLFGDIVAVYDTNGVRRVTYAYDAWGLQISSGLSSEYSAIAAKNPFRYRGYYYDSETNLYYLNSRYYDPVASRFVSPDSAEYLGANGDLNSYNLYAYCSNNPVMYIDPSGHSVTLVIIGAILGIAAGFGATVYSDYEDDGVAFNGSKSVVDYAANTIVSGMLGAFIGYVAPAAGSFLSSNFTIGTVALASGKAIAVTVSGAQIATAVATAGMVLFASEHRPKDNKKQNEQFRAAMKELNITDRDKMRRVHDRIRGKNLGYKQLVDFIKLILNLP